MSRLPNIGSDSNNWGAILNDFLSQAHNADGTHKNSAVVTNVKDFGAFGDGTTDDYAAINAAITATPAGGILYFPTATYLVKSQITIDKRLIIMGDGRYSTTIKADASVGAGPLLNWNNSSFRPGASLRNISFDLSANTGIAAVYMHNVRNGAVENVHVDYGTIGIQLDTAQAMDIINCEVYNTSSQGFLCSGTSSSGNNFVNCFVDATTVGCTALYDITGGIDWWFIGCRGFRAPGGAFNVNYGWRADYVSGSGANTNATIALIRCSVDGISDRTSDSATVAGVYFRGIGNSIISNSHLSGYSQSDATSNKALRLDQCNSIRIQDNWISGHGIHFTGSASDSVKVTNNQFYSADTSAAQANITTPPTNLDWHGNNLGQGSSNLPITDSPANFYSAINRYSQVAFGLNLNRPNGALYETIDVMHVATNSTTFTSGTLYLFAIFLPRGLKISNINWMSGATALVNGTSPHYWVALFDGSKNLLAQSTDNTAKTIAANTLITDSLSSAVTTTSEGKYYIGIMVNSGTSGTQPSFSNFAGLSAVGGLSGGPRAATADTGLTTTAPATAGSTSNIGNAVYAFVN